MKKIVIFLLFIGVLALGARHFYFLSQMKKRKAFKMPPPMVNIKKIKKVSLENNKEYIARTSPKEKVDIVPRIDGYLKKIFFEEGDTIQKGDLLFLIEPNEYKAEVEKIEADIENAKAILVDAEKNLKRMKELVEKDYISKSNFDKALANRNVALAKLNSQKALLNKAKLKLSYTKIYSPIKGKIGNLYFTKGNFVGPQKGKLATIIDLDPIYVTYNIPADDFVKEKLESTSQKNNAKQEVILKLSDGTLYSYSGIQNFFDNKIDESTGTLKMRATFPNPKGILLPGQLGKISVKGKAQKVLIIPQEAVLANNQTKYAFVVDKNNIAKMRKIELGEDYKGSFILKKGINEGENVIIKGIQKVQPQKPVNIIPASSLNFSKKGKKEYV